MDEDVLKEFEKEFNMKVVYDTFSTNEDMYVKIKSGGSTYDVIFPSDYMLTRMLNEGMLEESIWRRSQSQAFGSPSDGCKSMTRRTAIPPYMGDWAFCNTTMVDEIDGWDALWDRNTVKILMLDNGLHRRRPAAPGLFHKHPIWRNWQSR